MGMDITTGGTPAGGAIVSFPRRRGRPRKIKPSRDTGTPELVMRRLRQETAEALDLCMERGIITPQQHWCGIHLRWLYTLRYGAPGVRAVDPTHLGGNENRLDDPEWRSSREKEYHEAMQELSRRRLAAIVLEVCIYNERPGFLSRHVPATAAGLKKIERELSRFREGLDVLAGHWKR